MILEIHDTEPGNTIVARVNVDYDYMAEQWVKDIVVDELNLKTKFNYPLDKMVLL